MNNLNNMQNDQYMYDQKKNNGKGIFYGVIAVATLIVAIIGATFAYFTASANSTENALNATAATVTINYEEGDVLSASNLIPASSEVVAKAYAQPTADEYNTEHGCSAGNGAGECSSEQEHEHIYQPSTKTWESSGNDSYPAPAYKEEHDAGTQCVDDNGYFVCAVYSFTVNNQGNVDLTLAAKMTVNENTFRTIDKESATALSDQDNAQAICSEDDSCTNLALKYMVVKSDRVIDVTKESTDATTTKIKTSVPVEGDSDLFTKEIIGSSSSDTYYVVVWLEENDYKGHYGTTSDTGSQTVAGDYSSAAYKYESQDFDQTKTFKATIVASVAGGEGTGGNVTGQINNPGD